MLFNYSQMTYLLREREIISTASVTPACTHTLTDI